MKQNKNNGSILRRGLVMLFVFLGACLVLLIRLFVLQVINYDEYHQKVIENITSETVLPAARGTIYDCNMNELAYNLPVERVFISPCDMQEDEEMKLAVCQYLSEKLGVDYNTILEKANKANRKDETIQKNVDEAVCDEIRAFIDEYNEEVEKENADLPKDEQRDKINCIHFASGYKRYYPFNTLASQAIGFTGADGNGLFGLELQYDEELSGTDGRVITSVNAHGEVMPTKYETMVEAQDGYDIVTTIDYRIQSSLEHYLQDSFYDSVAQGRVCGIVMDVNTGAVLAMGTYPAADLNNPYELDDWSKEQLAQYTPETEEYAEQESQLRQQLWNNKCVSYLYEPGSTFKIVTAAMAFEEKATTDSDTYVCTWPYYLDLGGGQTERVNCWKVGGHGTITFRRGLQQSCNPTLMQVAAKIGRYNFYKYFQAFGMTEKTGIDLPGEFTSIYHDYADFYITELSIYSFGQTFKVTPMQQLCAISAVANGGTLVTPYLVSKLLDSDGNVVKTYEPESRRQVVSQEVCDQVAEILAEGVATDGGARNAYVRGYDVAAKTGTSQKRDKIDPVLGDIYRVGSCVAFAPADDPQVAILILADEPMGDSVYGSMVAAPYVAETMSEVLPYLNISPSYSENELAELQVAVPDCTGMTVEQARADIESKGLTCHVYGEGDTIVQQIPKYSSQVTRSNGTIYLYCGEEVPQSYTTVPNLSGMSISQCIYWTTARGLNLNITGPGSNNPTSPAHCETQSLEPESQVLYGTTLTIYTLYDTAAASADGG